MYSPRIDEDLIPTLYRLAKARGIHVTTLVDGIIRQAVDVRTATPKASPVIHDEQKQEAA